MPDPQRWRFECLAKEFEALMRDLNDCQDAEQRKVFLLRMKIVIDRVDEFMEDRHRPS
jgi:hypothetical protein